MPPSRLNRTQTAVSVAILLVLTESVYLPRPVLLGNRTLFGWDYMMLHIRRLAFAREALLGSSHTLPGWFPREFLGAPFAANLQSFSWLPTHWALLAFDPGHAYAAAVVLAAGLAAVFTYAYCRQIGLAQLASIAAGWTFACAGFFAARVEVGHLTLLEAYPGLPLLLLVVERVVDPQLARRRTGNLLIVALTSACLAVAGHPQLPLYTFGAAILYVLWIGRRALRAQLLAAIVLGAGASASIWWPMIGLIHRSSRTLALDPPSNDIVLPYRRLLALLAPGIDGWPAGVSLSARHAFIGYSHPGYFWDTVAYVGILPWMAVTGLALRCVLQKRLPAPRWNFLALLGCGSVLCALPLVSPLRHSIPWTLLRSPARLLYLFTFCLAVGLGAAVDAALRGKPARCGVLIYPAILFCLALHGRDLTSFARLFLLPVERHEMDTPAIRQLVARNGLDARIAVSRGLALSISSRYDDAGGFDSIFLAEPYRAFLALSGAPMHRNEEVVDAAQWRSKALKAASVHQVITPERRSDLELLKSTSGLQVYNVPNPGHRATFLAADNVRFGSDERILSELARDDSRPEDPLWLPAKERNLLNLKLANAEASCGRDSRSSVVYTRPSSDEIAVHVNAACTGFLYVAEAYDPGWRAAVDGATSPILKANGFAMAVALRAGTQTVRLRYHTPGRAAGAVIALFSVILLSGIVLIPRKRSRLQGVE